MLTLKHCHFISDHQIFTKILALVDLYIVNILWKIQFSILNCACVSMIAVRTVSVWKCHHAAEYPQIQYFCDQIAGFSAKRDLWIKTDLNRPAETALTHPQFKIKSWIFQRMFTICRSTNAVILVNIWWTKMEWQRFKVNIYSTQHCQL